MKSSLYVTFVTIALLVALMLPASASAQAVSGSRAGGQQTSQEQAARRGPNAMCQSGTACGG